VDSNLKGVSAVKLDKWVESFRYGRNAFDNVEILLET
jgi:hypothetical protein